MVAHSVEHCVDLSDNQKIFTASLSYSTGINTTIQKNLKNNSPPLLVLVFVLSSVFVGLGADSVSAIFASFVFVGSGSLGASLFGLSTRQHQFSLISIMGPGFVLGGPFAFLIFQLAGCGIRGKVVVIAILLGCTLWQVSAHQTDDFHKSLRRIFLGAILCTQFLCQEFPILLPYILVFSLFYFTCDTITRVDSHLGQVALGSCVAVLLIGTVTVNRTLTIPADDYQFFEVLARNLSEQSPFSNWGAMNWSLYHWLSYGQVGMFDVLIGKPSAFVSLVGIGPALFSFSLGASLIILVETVVKSERQSEIGLLLTSGLLATSVKWSGLSTGATYATLVGSLALILTTDVNYISRRRLTILGIVCMAIISLTKLPTIFAAGSALVAFFAVLNSNIQMMLPTRYRFSFSYILGVLVMTPLLFAMSASIGYFEIKVPSTSLGQISSIGFNNLLFFRIAQVPWLILIFLNLVILLRTDRTRTPKISISNDFAMLGLIQSVVGLVLDAVVEGNANVHQYFSGPFYFLGIVSTSVSLIEVHKDQDRSRFIISTIAAIAFVGFGVFWVKYEILETIWSLLIPNSLSNSLFLTLSQHVLQSGQVGIVGFAVVTLVFSWFMSRMHRFGLPVVVAAFFAVGQFSTIGHLVTSSYSELILRSKKETASNYGDDEIRKVGEWIKANTKDDETIATNQLYESPETMSLGSSYLLAVWTDRTFLVLGPRFSRMSSDVKSAISISEQFGKSPTKDTARALLGAGVRWFILDLQFDRMRPSSKSIKYQNSRYLVIDLLSL